MKTCDTCIHWQRYDRMDYGRCGVIDSKVMPDVVYGWDGGYIDCIDTDFDFGCVLHEEVTST